jgi:16S rRNA (cytosine1402-N4)-methyltransferase
MSPTSYHEPVMQAEVLTHLNLKSSGTYLDLTFGGGGHAKLILEKLDQGRLIGVDRDPDAQEEAAKISDPRFSFIHANYRYIRPILHFQQIGRVDGILADLGTSSHQLNTATRGFAARLEGPLDMRMNPAQQLKAMHIIARYSKLQLVEMLSRYGEIKNAKKAADHIITARTAKAIYTTAQLCNALKGCLPPSRPNKYYAQVFQALRIVVNDELGALENLLRHTHKMLKPQGRLVILTYHSLEDRMVKRFIKSGNLQGKLHTDIYGNVQRSLTPLSNKAIMPSEAEIAQNSRARSARLRIATPSPDTSNSRQ